MTTQQPSPYAVSQLHRAVNGPCGARRREATLQAEIENWRRSGAMHEYRLTAARQRLELAWLDALVQLARL